MIKKIKMLYPKDDWSLRAKGTQLESIENKDGYYMFTGCAGVSLHNDKHNKKCIVIGSVEWLVFAIFANWRVQSLNNRNKMNLAISIILPVFLVIALSSLLLIL